MKKRYNVRYYMDGNYEVVETNIIHGERGTFDYEETEVVVFQGDLANCEAYILDYMKMDICNE